MKGDETMKPKKSGVLPYLLTSLALIIIAIAFTAILNRTQNTQSTTSDIRARANVPSLVKVTGTIETVNADDGTLTVANLRFEDSDKNLGKWTVTLPKNFNSGSVFEGSRVTITVDPPSMLAETKTLTAVEIKITR